MGMPVTARWQTSCVMPRMERQVNAKRQMDVDRARQKRKNAQREAHQETEKIKVRPVS